MDTFTEIKDVNHSVVLLLRKKASSRNFPQQVDSRILKTEHGLVMGHPECTHIHTRCSRGSCMSNTDHAAPQVWNTACPVKHSYCFTQ